MVKTMRTRFKDFKNNVWMADKGESSDVDEDAEQNMEDASMASRSYEELGSIGADDVYQDENSPMKSMSARGFSAREISNINGETYTPDDSKRSKVKDDLVSFYSYTNYYARSKGMYAFCGVPVWKEGDASDAPLHFGEIPEAEWE